ncbi:MAG: hypothetical protein ACR2KW_05330, partial [Rubrobacter sp.]
MESLRDKTFELDEQRIAWEGLASSCASPVKKFLAFAVLGFIIFVAAITTVILFYNVFGERSVAGQGITPPDEAFYLTLFASVAFAAGGFMLWLVRSLRSYRSFAGILRSGGHDPRRPTRDGLAIYSDEQLLSLRARYERAPAGGGRSGLFEGLFGFQRDDSFTLGPLSALPGTFEMDALRVEWEMNLIVGPEDGSPEISWWTEGRREVLPRKTDEHLKLLY